jgi:hypothetical protein
VLQTPAQNTNRPDAKCPRVRLLQVKYIIDDGRVAKGYRCHRPGPLAAVVHLPLTAAKRQTTVICPAISGTTPLPVLSVPG